MDHFDENAIHLSVIVDAFLNKKGVMKFYKNLFTIWYIPNTYSKAIIGKANC